jgi:tetrahydromethanopterin S-methyltransferase subunit G
MTRAAWNGLLYGSVVSMLLLSIAVAWQAMEAMTWWLL